MSHNTESQSGISKKKELLRDALTLFLAIFIVVVSYLALNPWSQSVINNARAERQTLDNTSIYYYRATVTRLNSEQRVNEEFSGVGMLQQNVTAQITEGDKKGQEVDITATLLSDKSSLSQGLGIVIREERTTEGASSYSFADIYRMDKVLIFLLIFIVLVIALSGFKGLGSFFSLLFSIIILVQFMLPQMILGANVFWITFISSLMIVLISIFLSHGFNRQSVISVSSIMLTIVVSVLISAWAVSFTRLTGLGSDDAFFLASSQKNQFLDVQGLLLAGIVIGTIGVLDDVTITQAATVNELNLANEDLSSSELFWRAMNVGREHVVSMVNTLAMAYAGSALPLLLLLTLGNGNPLWVSINNEIIVEEIVRTIAGSIGLLMAVPITTFLASRIAKMKPGAWKKIFQKKKTELAKKEESVTTEKKVDSLKAEPEVPKKQRISLG